MRTAKWLGTIAIGTGVPLLILRAFPRATPAAGTTGSGYLDALMVFTSLAIWLSAPAILRGRSIGAWIAYGLLSPIVGGVVVALLSVPSLIIHFHIIALLILAVIIALSLPIGSLVGLAMYGIWRDPKLRKPNDYG